jgi:uncharacterized repeat protein (TIGR01451 family)
MKHKIIKTLFTAVALTGVFALVSKVQAGGPVFNDHPDDAPLITVLNATDGETDWKTSASADVGDEVSFRLWIHNNADDTWAENVIARVSIPSNYSTNHSVGAFVSADNADSISGSAVVNLSQSGRLEYMPGKTFVYSDVYGSGYQWPNDDITGDGINLGRLRGCWPYVIQLTFRTKVQAEPDPDEPRLTMSKTVSYGAERDNGVWYEAISKDKKKFGPGEFLYYKVLVKNIGDATVLGVTLEDQLPPYLYWHSGDGTYKSGPNIVKFDLGDIAEDATIVLTYRLRVRDVLPNGERTQENVVIARSSNFQELQDSTVVWIKGPDVVEKKTEEIEIITTRVERVEKEIIEVLPETGGNFLIPNLVISLGSLITGFGLKKLER